MSIKFQRIDKFRIKLFQTDKMKTDALIYASDKIKIEDEAIGQLQNAASIDEEAKVFATPDLHRGYGVPIGSVLASPNYISPSAVGYDINCGMRLITTGLKINQAEIKKISDHIRNSIPLGEGKKNIILNEKEFIRLLKHGVKGLENISTNNQISKIFKINDFEKDIFSIEEQGCIKGGNLPKVLHNAITRGKDQLGTLGGGNHFIELQLVSDIYDDKIASDWRINKDEFVIMIHSGSRGFGHEIAGHYMK